MGKENLNEEQSRYFDILMQGHNAFVSGDAGVGKSYLISEFIKAREEAGYTVLVCAPTGIAAINVDGVTAHRAFNAPLHPILYDEKVKVLGTLVKSDTVIIDEISMCRFDLFSYIARCIGYANKVRIERQNKPPIQLVVVGDFFQLPPVMTDEVKDIFRVYYRIDVGYGFAFQSPYWAKFNFVNLILTKCMRQNDTDFIRYLNMARKGDIRSLDFFRRCSSSKAIEDAIYLCGTNKRAKEQNDYFFSKLDGETFKYYSEIEGEVKDSDKMTEDELEFKVGARVMTLTNDLFDRYQNGSLGVITKCTDKGVEVRIDKTGNKVFIEPYTWEIKGYSLKSNPDKAGESKLSKDTIGTFTQLPLKMAFAITIHKSQGQTYDKVNLNPYCWDCGQLYVALSRVRTIDGLFIDGFMSNKFLIVSQDVVAFYQSLRR